MSKMKRFTNLLRTKSSENAHHHSSSPDLRDAPADSPEASGTRAIRLFCESGSASNRDEEVLHLPTIVDSAESSPLAASAAASQIRQFLTREWSAKPHVQYNAIMLIRILSDNPGPTFTRCLGEKSFVSTVKELLRNCKDKSTQTILRENLDSLEVNKGYDDGLQPLLAMWRKEKGQSARLSRGGPPRAMPNGGEAGMWQAYPPPQGQGMAFPNGGLQAGGYQSRRQLPSPSELAGRIEEARNTAKILMQLVQSTPAEQVMSNELIKEFSERCQSAGKSMQSYINCDSPPPDDDTLQTLIETNEQLSLASSRYQRAVLAARRAMGAQVMTPPALTAAEQNGDAGNGHTGAFSAPSYPPLQPQNGGYAGGSYFQQPAYPVQPQEQQAYQPPPGPPPHLLNNMQSRSPPPPQQSTYQHGYHQPLASNNPFADPDEGLYDDRPPANPHQYQPQQQQQQQQQPHNFAIDATEPSHYTSPSHRRNTLDLENAYSDPQPNSAGGVSAPSPTFTRDARGSDAGVSDMSSPQVSPQETRHGSGPRPGPGPWHNSGITPSYVGRQSSAANGLTMHGASGR